MRSTKISTVKWTGVFGTCMALGVIMISVAGCVLEPYPEPYASPPAVAPSPAYYGYSYYPEYPPYYYGGPSVGVYYGYDHGGYRHWR
jgi:hypothetical protein